MECPPFSVHLTDDTRKALSDASKQASPKDATLVLLAGAICNELAALRSEIEAAWLMRSGAEQHPVATKRRR